MSLVVVHTAFPGYPYMMVRVYGLTRTQWTLDLRRLREGWVRGLDGARPPAGADLWVGP